MISEFRTYLSVRVKKDLKNIDSYDDLFERKVILKPKKVAYTFPEIPFTIIIAVL